jgi:uncharacterized membrane protein YhaH (DUF805 family)
MSDSKKRIRRYFYLVGCLIIAAGNWPILSLANRIQPTIFGFPFMFAYVVTFVPILTLFLYIAYRLGI